ncbi:MAG: alpha/beta hydrolase [Spirosomataceae bacterium]
MIQNVILNGVSLQLSRILVAEDRPTLIFLHDSLGCIELWRDFPEQLGGATHCNVLVYDRQGYGKSSPFDNTDRNSNYLEVEADVLHWLMEALSIPSAFLFGHSDGGSIALIAAAKYPEKIKGVITEGAHIFVEDITLKGIHEAVEAFQNTNLRQRLMKYHGEKTEAVVRAWADTWLSEGFRHWNIESFLAHILCPVLVIQGEKDEYGSLAQVDGIISQVAAEAQKFILPSIGHTPHKEAKEAVLEKTTRFLHQIAPGLQDGL